jgi:hypothetical protein
VSSDGRWLPLTFGDPGHARQVMDVWLLDLANGRWHHLPEMPTFAALKATSLTWAADGRLVLLGHFYTAGDLLVTWRPGEPALAVLPYERPDTDPDEPSTDAFIVL